MCDEEINDEKNLFESEEMAAVGILASGIAHEFNNINSVIRGHLESILFKNDLRESVKEQLEIVLKMVRRSVDITRSLMVFSKKDSVEKTNISLSIIAKDVVTFVQNEFIAEGIKIISEIEDVNAYLNESYITQVFMNLIINAKHAMIDSDKKVIIIKVGYEGKQPYFSITDSGCGIEDSDKDKLFNPFFSTKGEHAYSGSPLSKVKGAGLGLSICHTIITKHHLGHIDVLSKVDIGSKFTVYLEKSDEKLKSKICELNNEVLKGCGERVLIVDDEYDIIDCVIRVLNGSGYKTIGFIDAKKALKEHIKNPFDAVIVDLQMPKMSGTEFLKEINKSDVVPGKIIITGRGFSKDDFKELDIIDVVQKPFSFKKLLYTLKIAVGERNE